MNSQKDSYRKVFHGSNAVICTRLQYDLETFIWYSSGRNGCRTGEFVLEFYKKFSYLISAMFRTVLKNMFKQYWKLNTPFAIISTWKLAQQAMRTSHRRLILVILFRPFRIYNSSFENRIRFLVIFRGMQMSFGRGSRSSKLEEWKRAVYVLSGN